MFVTSKVTRFLYGTERPFPPTSATAPVDTVDPDPQTDPPDLNGGSQSPDPHSALTPLQEILVLSLLWP